MKIFYSGLNDINLVDETDSIDIISSKYIISIRTSGIHIKNRETNLPVDLSQDNVIFDTNLDLT